MKIRKASEKDFNTILEIELNSGYKWTEKENAETINIAKMFSEEERFLIGEYEKNPIAYVAYRIVSDTFFLDVISIKKLFHGKGFGKLIMEYLFDLAKKQKCNKFVLEVWAKNDEAIRLYNKFNFKLIEVKKKHYPNGDDKLVMEVDL